MLKECIYCKKDFETNDVRKKYCCSKCRERAKIRPSKTKEKVEKECLFCGKVFITSDSKKKYCSKKCYHDIKIRNSKIYEKVCKFCGKKFFTTNHSTLYCSDECLLKRKYINKCMCEICGKEFLSQLKDSKYCCSKCKSLGYKKRNIISHILNSSYIPKSTNTKPHKMVLDKLNYNNIISEYRIEIFSIDIFIPEFNLPIEINGGYWHCDPRFCEIKTINRFKNAIIREERKNKLIFDKLKSHILYLWEYDIKHNIEMCLSLIEYYIKNDGLIDNYDSFNYHLKNGIITINNHIIRPYREYSLDELNNITV